MNSVCRRRSVSSKRAPKCSVNSVCSVREKPSQRVSQLFFFSQKNTDEQNTQRPTETLSQPISQNLTATFSSNALWTLYAGGVLWARNVRLNAPWTLCALWEKKPPKHKRKTSQAWEINLPSMRDKPPHASYWQPNRGNLTYHSPPYGGGAGGGANWCRV